MQNALKIWSWFTPPPTFADIESTLCTYLYNAHSPVVAEVSRSAHSLFIFQEWPGRCPLHLGLWSVWEDLSACWQVLSDTRIHWIVPHTGVKIALCACFDVCPADIAVIPPSVAPWCVSMPPDPLLAQRLGIQGTVFGFVGQPRFYKGLLELVTAWCLAGRRDATLLIVGGAEGEDMARAREILRWGGAEETVRFVDWVSSRELPHYYALMEALVVPSYWDSFGRIVAEAAFLQVPVIMREDFCCGTNQVLGPEECMRYRTLAELATILQTFAPDPEKTARAYRRACAEYPYPVVAQKLRAWFRERCGNPDLFDLLAAAQPDFENHFQYTVTHLKDSFEAPYSPVDY